MFELDDITKQWKEDSIINDMALDTASQDGARFHAKYLEMLSVTKLRLKREEAKLDILLKEKWLWYQGRLDKDTIDRYGWEYDPFDGCNKPLKGDMDRYYNADPHIQEATAKVEYVKTIKETLEEIVSQLRWRHQTIRNIIEWKKFTSGI